MNKQDQREFDKRYHENTEFHALYMKLIRLMFHVQQELIITTKSPIMAHEIREGKPLELYMIRNPGQDAQQLEREVARVVREAEQLARELSAYFPEHRRWHWQEVFLRQVFGASTVEQRQCGGRPSGRSVKAKQKRLELAQDYWNIQGEYRERGECLLTYKEFAESRGVSVRTLKRALKLYRERQNMEAKKRHNDEQA